MTCAFRDAEEGDDRWDITTEAMELYAICEMLETVVLKVSCYLLCSSIIGGRM